MKYALIATVSFNDRSKRDNLADNIRDKIASKILWANSNNPKVVSVSMGEDGTPTVNVILRFVNKDDRDTTSDYIIKRIKLIPALSGRVNTHICYHDELGANSRCEPESEFSL